MHQDISTQHKFTEELLFPVITTRTLTVLLTHVSKGRMFVQTSPFQPSQSQTPKPLYLSALYTNPPSVPPALEMCKKCKLKYKSHFAKEFCIFPCQSRSYSILYDILYWYLSASFGDLQNILRIISQKYDLLRIGHTQNSTIMLPSKADFLHFDIKLVQTLTLILCMSQSKTQSYVLSKY